MFALVPTPQSLWAHSSRAHCLLAFSIKQLCNSATPAPQCLYHLLPRPSDIVELPQGPSVQGCRGQARKATTSHSSNARFALVLHLHHRGHTLLMPAACLRSPSSSLQLF
ncbi:hypothetical protein BGY98DRAFT_1003597, partial [Russula aff. rugulosa BPL654]